MPQFTRISATAAVLTMAGALGCSPSPPVEPTASPPAAGDTATHTTPPSPEAIAPENSEPAMSVGKSSFGTTPEGVEVSQYTCVNGNGLVVSLIDYGATVTRVETPDREGRLANVNLGFDRLEGYLGEHPYFGATVGRYCNRIARGRFTLDGREYALATNNAPNHLHGGVEAFHRKIWDAEPFASDDGAGVRFRYVSPDGEEGYPGRLEVTAEYTLTPNNELRVVFTATTDAPTVLNPTNHNYWNLGGAGSGSILAHELMLAADRYLPADETLIPTGELADVAGTPFDFTTSKAIGAELADVPLEPAGYDHCFALRGPAGELRLAARAADPATGRVMEVLTTQPGIQFYTGNFLDGSEANGGFDQHEAFCLETQHFPDSPNQESFPSTVLRPGEVFRQETVHRFSVE